MFTGLSVRQFKKLVRIVAARGGAQTGTGRRWGLSLADRVLLVAVYYRTNLTFRQVALLFGISKSAVGRVIDHLAPLLVLSPVKRRHSPETVLIVDGTLVPTHDQTISASSKNYRYSTNLQVVIDANSRLTIAVGQPTPDNRNDCRAYTDSGVDQQCTGAHVMADGGYQGNPDVIMPYRSQRAFNSSAANNSRCFLLPNLHISPSSARASSGPSIRNPTPTPFPRFGHRTRRR